MSRVYFHTPTDEAELSGSERAWLNHLATGPADNAWDLRGPGGFDHAQQILAMAENEDDYLQSHLREAQEASSRSRYDLIHRLTSALDTRLHVGGLDLNVHGVQLHTDNLGLNCAIVAGSDPIVLAAKIHGWCESHAWVDGPHRAWLADIIEQGLRTGLYRTGMGWEGPGEYSSGPGVVPLLRSRDDEPVVMSYSVGEQFPNSDVGDWMPPWPDGVRKHWDALTEEQQEIRSAREEEWYELSAEEQWEISMRGLRAERPWARLSPATFRNMYFHLPLTAYDVMDPSRADHVREVYATSQAIKAAVTSAVAEEAAAQSKEDEVLS